MYLLRTNIFEIIALNSLQKRELPMIFQFGPQLINIDQQ